MLSSKFAIGLLKANGWTKEMLDTACITPELKLDNVSLWEAVSLAYKYVVEEHETWSFHYKYYIVYETPQDQGVGTFVLTRTKLIESSEDIMGIVDYIKEKHGHEELVVTNFILISKEPVC